MFDFLSQVWLIDYDSSDFWPRNVFRTVCRRLVRGIKEGWSVIDIVRYSRADTGLGVRLWVQCGPEIRDFCPSIPDKSFTLLLGLGWRRKLWQFYFHKKRWVWVEMQLNAIQVRFSGIKIYRSLKEGKTRIRVQNRLGPNKLPIAANLMMTDIVKLRKTVRSVCTRWCWWKFFVGDLNVVERHWC